MSTKEKVEVVLYAIALILLVVGASRSPKGGWLIIGGFLLAAALAV